MLDLQSLALETCFGPFSHISVNSKPDETFCDQPLSCTNSRRYEEMQGVKYRTTEGGRHKELGVPVLLSHSSDIAEFTCGTVTNRREEEPEDWSVQSSVSSAWALAKHSISRNGDCAT